MSIAEFSVRRPIFVSMIALIVVVLGGFALRKLPVDLFPEIDFPAVSITTEYEDASPEEVEELITRPIERGVSAVTGIEEISSVSAEGVSSITIKFTWGANLDEAVSDIRDRIDRVIKSLPDDVDRPTLRRFDSAAMPIMRLGVGTSMNLLEAKKLLEDQVQYRLERIDGVASATVSGGLTREIQVLLDMSKAKMLNISLDELIAKLEAANVTTPAGNLKESRIEIRLRTPGTFSNLDEIRDLAIASAPDGGLVYLRDIAEVVDTHETLTRIVRVNGKPGIFIAIYKQSGANTVAVARGVQREIGKINLEMAHQFQITPLMNSAEFIERAISNVADTAVYGGLLAVLVLLIFLCNLRSTLIIAISIPLSVVATFMLVYFCGYTLNVMTLGGLALGIGMLVDNSIVVLENITRLHDGGLDRREAAIRGTNEVAAAIVASTLTTVAVFLPMLFASGLAGVMFRQFAMVVGFALACSLAAALAVVPMLAGLVMKESVRGDRRPANSFSGWIFYASSRGFGAMENYYAWLLDGVLAHRWLTIALSLALLSASCLLASLIGTELMPASDEGRVRITMEDAVGTGVDFVNDTVVATEETIRRETPGLEAWMTAAGASTWRASGGHKAEYNLKLAPRTQRQSSTQEIAAKLGKMLAGLPGVIFRARSSQSFVTSGGSGSDAIKIDIRGYDFATAEALARRIEQIVRGVVGVTDVSLSRDLGVPERRIMIDREKAAALKVSVKNIADALRTVLAGSEAGNYRENGDEYTILVKVKDADRLTVDNLLDVTVRNASGERIVLRNLISTVPVLGPVTIERKNQERVLTVSANLFNRDLGSAIAELQEKLKVLDPLPAEFSISFAGDYEDQVETFRELGVAFVLALILVYMVMACQFESLKDPLVVMFSVPLAAIGVILGLFLTKTTFNMQSFIGCIMLAGIVVNNAILLVDTANLLRRRDGLHLSEAVREAGRRRLRPILMTTLTTVLGLVPLALGWGDGGETQAPLARAVIGGLTSSTLITLFFIPAVYSLVEGWRERLVAKHPAETL